MMREEMDIWIDFPGPNAAYVEELYERYQRDPNAVDAATRAYFELSPAAATPKMPASSGVAETPAPPSVPCNETVMGLVNLANAIRDYGHLAAQIDPLGSRPPGDPALELGAHDLTEADLEALPPHLVGGPIGEQAANGLDAIRRLRERYQSHLGFDFSHLRQPQLRAWLREAVESGRFRPPHDPIDPVALLDRLTQVEVFEQFLQKFYPGKTRFSIEGLDMIVPILDEVIGGAAEDEVRHILLGMAHRGRLNVLAHLLNKPYAQILAEFKDPLEGQHWIIRDDLGWTGDVKYHKGARRALQGGEAVDVEVSMISNPSHLEFVNPVVVGMARAAMSKVDQPGPPRLDDRLVLPVLIHGDASFPGQGIVAETLNLQNTEGFRTGGTVHIIANNQVGFTALRDEVCSTLYVSDLAKGFKIPVIHVNADDPEACIEAARIAYAYTHEFERDFLIDLIGYRRYGHNEGDDPTFTQPIMYKIIDEHPSVRSLWADELPRRGALAAGQAEQMVQARMAELQQVADALRPERDVDDVPPQPPPPGAARRAETAVPAAELRALNDALLAAPAGFAVNSKLLRVLDRRRKAFEAEAEADVPVDWSTAESLALASILADGVPIRFTGEDVERGTFSHRHAVWHNVENGRQYIPLQALPQSCAAFEIHNSPLSEAALVGFEYGYSIYDPRRLVIWEAQYGDFVNGAQVLIDEYLVSARAKWGQTPSLVLLLPHGFEGQGPDHSSARVERFLQAAAETNMRVAYPSTAAQYFHLLRRQAALLEDDPLPLIVLTPKSLLRNPTAAATLADLAEGRWHPVIDDPRGQERRDAINRLILCSGKVYFDLMAAKQREARPDVAIARLEQLYVFPMDEMTALIESYDRIEDVVWVQEEPENMGAWDYVRPKLEELLGGCGPLRYVGRPRASSPSEGSTAWHLVNQNALIERAYATDRAEGD
jgi:2-oxoglutarate dehydrogenase E1 component